MAATATPIYIYPPFQVTVDTGALATAAKQDQQTALLTSIDTHTPAQGQAIMANSSPVVIASNQSAVPVSGPLTDTQLRASSVPVTGPLTDTQLRASAVPVSGTVTANQGTGGVSAWKVDGSAVTQPVSGTVAVSNFPATQPVSGTVAVTQSTSPWVVDGSGFTQPVSGTVTATGPLTDTQLRASAVPVTLASTTITGTVATTQSTSPWVVDGSGFTQPVSGPLTDTQLRASAVPVSGTVTATGPLTDTQLRATPVPVSGTVTATGPLTDTQLRASAVPVTLTSTTVTGTVAVTQSTSPWVVDGSAVVQPTIQAGKQIANAPFIYDYSSVNVTSGSYVQMIASTSNATSEIEIFDSSGQTLYLAVGAVASESDQIIVVPGGNGRIPLKIPASSRISLKATGTTASVGIFVLNLYQ